MRVFIGLIILVVAFFAADHLLWNGTYADACIAAANGLNREVSYWFHRMGL